MSLHIPKRDSWTIPTASENMSTTRVPISYKRLWNLVRYKPTIDTFSKSRQHHK